MLFTNATQFAVLLLILVIGWLFGFASHTGGKVWRARYDDERARFASYRTEQDGRLSEAKARIATLERQHEDLIANQEIAARGGISQASRRRTAASAAVPAATQRDDLTKLRGVDAGLARKLKAEGVTKFADLADLSDQDEIALEQRLDLPAGYILGEQLREQAKLLATGKTAKHTARFS